jgi:glycosyltransferase involved in cell wall biosynthesis
MKDIPQISLVIPVKDEAESLPELTREIQTVMRATKKSYELIFVDDGSTDTSWIWLERLFRQQTNVKVFKHRGNFGKSIALRTGFENAAGEIVITLDADLQDNPKEIPRFLAKIGEGFDLVSGWKQKRYDPISKTLPSKIGNWLTRLFTGVKIHDLNCGYKAYRREVVKNLHLYGELYKYIPVLAAKQNFKVTEIIVEHRQRKYGKSKFGVERNIKGLLDLLTIVFLTGYRNRPGHFFGTIGISFFGMGFLIGLYITYLRITTGSIQYRQPLLFLGMLLMIIGIQLVTTGLLAEMFVNFNQKDKTTAGNIEKTLI